MVANTSWEKRENWKEKVLEVIELRLREIAQAITYALEEHERICKHFGRFDYGTFLHEEAASLDLSPYLAPSLQRDFMVPLRLGFRYQPIEEYHFWLQVETNGKRYLCCPGAGVRDAEVATILSEATGFHPERVTALLEALGAFRAQIEEELSLRAQVLLTRGEEYQRRLERVLQELEKRGRELVPYIEQSPFPSPSPLLDKALTLSLKDFLPRVWAIQQSPETRIKIPLEGKRTREEMKKILWHSADLKVYERFLEILEGFVTRVGSILAEAKSLSQGVDIKEIFLKSLQRLVELTGELEGLVRVYPFAREFLPQEPLVLDLGINPEYSSAFEVRALAVDFRGETVSLVYRDAAMDWHLIGKEAVEGRIAALLSLPEEEVRKGVGRLVEFVAILAQAYQEAHEHVKALLEKKGAQSIQELFLATRIKSL